MTYRKRYRYIYLQTGEIPLDPLGNVDMSIEHRCSSVLIWPEKERPSPGNTILTDPCFTRNGIRNAQQAIGRLGISFDTIGRIFITHPHHDHIPKNRYSRELSRKKHFKGTSSGRLSGVAVMSCPGHSPNLKTLLFNTDGGQSVCVAGDAILDTDWLNAWEYFRPNGYNAKEVVETWRSVVRILQAADIVIPGHGDSIHVTGELIKTLIRKFHRAEFSGRCPELKQELARAIGNKRLRV